MQTRTFGRLGWPVSEIGYGLWGMGGWSGSNDEESIAALERSIALGCTFFDTGLAYGNGKSEQLLGQVLTRHKDKTLRIATKVPPKNLRWPALPEYPLTDVFPADHIRQSTEISLSNMGLQTVDLQQLHVWTDAWAEDDRWMRAVDDLKREGLIRAFGISINRWQPESALKALSTGVVDSVQVVYNIFDQNPEDELFPRCRELGVRPPTRMWPIPAGSRSRARSTASRTSIFLRAMSASQSNWTWMFADPDEAFERMLFTSGIVATSSWIGSTVSRSDSSGWLPGNGTSGQRA